MSPSNLSPLLDILPPTITTTPCNTIESSIAGSQENKPPDRKRNEMKENLLVLEVQISSASGELQKLKAEQDELTPLAAIRGRICNRCHQSGHTKTTCKLRPCESSNNCKIREKHPEIKAKISSLQAELKELQKQHKNRTLRCRQRKIKIEVFSLLLCAIDCVYRICPNTQIVWN